MDDSALTPKDHSEGDQQRACLLAGAKRRQSDEHARRHSDRYKDQGETQIQGTFNDFHTFTFLDSVFTSREIARERNLPSGFLSASWIGSTWRWALPNAQRNSFGNLEQSSMFNRPVNLEKPAWLLPTQVLASQPIPEEYLDRGVNC